MIGERLKQARELTAYTQEQLADKTNVKQATIALIERDALAPREELVQALADELGFPRGFFDLPVDKDFPLGSLVYRKYARMRADRKKLSHRLAQQAFEISEFLAAQLKPIPIGLPRTHDEDPISAARLVRNAVGVDPTAPIRNLMHRLERVGVRVFVLPDHIPDLDAFSSWVEGRNPIVVLNPTQHGDRQLFSLAHEVGHLVMHYPATGGQDEIEKEANRFAGELLLPEDAIRAEMTLPVTLSLLAELKSRWRVSMAALLQRGKDLDIVTERQYKYLRMQMAKRGWVKQEPVEITPDRPSALRKMAEVAYGAPVNIRRIAKDANRPTFLVAQLIDTTKDSGPEGRVIGFRVDGRKQGVPT